MEVGLSRQRGSHRLTRHLKGRELGVVEGEYEVHLAPRADHGGTAVVDEVGSIHEAELSVLWGQLIGGVIQVAI